MTAVDARPVSLATGGLPPSREALELAVGTWEEYVRATGLADRTKTAYVRQVRRFLTWLVEQPEHGNGARWVSEPHRRDWAVRDYKRHVLTVEHLSPASVNLALAAIDNACTYMGIPPARVTREALPKRAPRALTEDEIRRVLRAAEPGVEVHTLRDYGLIYLLLNTGLRLGEAHALDVDDVQVTARTGRVVVRAGKGDRPRSVPLSAKVRPTAAELVRARRTMPFDVPAAFVNYTTRNRLAVSSIDRVIRLVGEKAGLDQPLSAHTFRHTFGTRLVRAGVDIVTVAEVMGHSNLETTRQYTRPSEADVAAAMEHLHVEP